MVDYETLRRIVWEERDRKKEGRKVSLDKGEDEEYWNYVKKLGVTALFGGGGGYWGYEVGGLISPDNPTARVWGTVTGTICGIGFALFGFGYEKIKEGCIRAEYRRRYPLEKGLEEEPESDKRDKVRKLAGLISPGQQTEERER